MRFLRETRIKMSFGRAVFLVIVGILLGSIFTFGIQYWNQKIAREECTEVKTQFLSYRELTHSHRTQEIAIDCANGERYFIDGVCINSELYKDLSVLSKGDSIALLIHPHSGTIVEFSTETDCLVHFDDAIIKLGRESVGFIILGAFMYACALAGLCYMISYGVKKRKNKV